MKRQLLFSIPLLFALMLLLSGNSQAQGFEDFTNSNLTGSYSDGSFVGNDGITWTYVHSRNEGDFPIDGNGIMLRRANEPSSLSAVLPGGIGNFSVDTRKAFTGNAQRQLELVINGIVIAEFLPDYGDGADDTVIPFIVEDINIGGNVEFELRLFGSTGNQQMVLDNIEWTGYGAVPPVVTNVTQVPDADITSETTVLVSAHVTEGDAAVTVVELHWGTESGVLENSIEMSPDRAVAYTADEPIPAQANGTTVYYVVYAEDADGESFTTLAFHYTVVDPAMATLPYFETFDEDLGDVYTYSVSGDTKFWVHSTFGDNGFADINGFNSGDIEDDWLILPGIDMAEYSNPVVLNFETAYNFGSFDEDNFLKLFYSEDYAGIGDPTLATWIELEFDLPETGGYTWTPSGDVLIPESEGIVHIALQYYYNPGNYRRWQVDNIFIEELVDYITLFEFAAVNDNLPDWFGSQLARGLATHGENLYVANRNAIAGQQVQVHDRLTGEITGYLNTTGMAGGTFAINDIETSEDGLVFAGNLAINPPAVFKIYLLDEVEEALPVIEFPLEDASRMGDKFAIVGSVDDGSAIVYAADATTPRVYKWVMVPAADKDGFVFADAPISISTAVGATNGSNASVAAMPNGDFYITGGGIHVYKLNADGSLIGAIPGGIVATGSSALKYLGMDGDDEILAVFLYGAGNEKVRLIRIPDGDPAAAVIEFDTPTLGAVNSTGNGSVTFEQAADGQNAEVYFLSATNGIAAYVTQIFDLEFPVYEPPLPATVLDIIVGSDVHTTLEAAVIAANLVDALSGEGPFTVFAPTDTAFDALPEGLLDDLLEEPEGLLTDILLYHVVGALAHSSDLEDGQVIETLLGEDVVVTISEEGVFINDAQVIVADLLAENGVVHVIDAVLVPPVDDDDDPLSVPWHEDFADNALPEGWTVEDLSGTGFVWEFSSGYADADSDAAGSGAGNMWTSLTTPVIDCSEVENAHLYLNQWFRPLGSSYGSIQVSVDGENWVGVVTHTTTVGDENFPYFEYDVSDIVDGEPQVWVRFEYNDAGIWAWYWRINEVGMYSPDPLPMPAQLVAPADGALDVHTAITLEWNPGGGSAPTAYKVYFGESNPPETEVYDGPETSVDVTGLDYSTTYFWQVVPYNDAGEATDSPVWSFTTMEDPSSELPWYENFDGFVNGTIPFGWQRTHNNWGVWDSNNAGGESAPELRFNWSPSATAVFKAVTPPIDPGDTESFGLTFMHSVDDYSGGYNLKVQTSVDGGVTWEDRWVLDIESKKDVPADREASNKADIPPTFEALNLSDLAGETFHIAFVYDGNSFNINQWYIDDIVVEAMDFFDLAFDVVGAFHELEIDDATITLNGITNEPGDYEFTDLPAGTYAYTVSRLCYADAVGVVTVTQNTLVEIELDLHILPGDANGDGVVDVLDLIAIGNFYIGNDPVNFCFHNADINDDGEIDVLDIIGVVNIFKKGGIAPHADLQSAPAKIYLSSDGIDLYSDGSLAGIQFEITGEMLQGLELILDLPNHEIIYVYQNGVIKALIFSMYNAAIPAGKISLVRFGNDVEAEWESVKAGNLNAEEVPVVTHDEEVTSIEEASDIAFTVYPNPASDILWVEFYNTGESSLSLINVQGQVVESQIVHEQGNKQISFNLRNLQAGIYVLRLDHNEVTLTQRILIK